MPESHTQKDGTWSDGTFGARVIKKKLAPGVTVRLVPESEIPGETTLDARVRNTRSDCTFGASQENSWHQE